MNILLKEKQQYQEKELKESFMKQEHTVHKDY